MTGRSGAKVGSGATHVPSLPHPLGDLPMTRWLIDGNNVMGSRPDRWWNDRPAAMARLAQDIAQWCWTHGDEVILVFDGPELAPIQRLAGGNLSIEFSGTNRRNAADDVIVALARAGTPSSDVVVTADRGLIARLGGRPVVGPGALLTRLKPRTDTGR